ncbi:MAG: PDZ domain-containing protein [Pyrinomonadaceae bacterium]|nr:PDZ domain-containing protein [Phycisphaerales bacterium]
MTHEIRRTTGTALASIAVLLSAANVLAQGAGGPPRPDDDRAGRPARGVPGQLLERRALRQDDMAPPPPPPPPPAPVQLRLDRAVEGRAVPRGGHGEGREQGLADRFEHRIRALEERVRVLSEGLRTKLRQLAPTQARGGDHAAKELYTVQGRFHDGARKELIERQVEGRSDRWRSAGSESHRRQGGPREALLAPGAPTGNHTPRLEERDIHIERLDGPDGVRGHIRIAPNELRGHKLGQDGPDATHHRPHVIGLTEPGTWQIEIRSLDGDGAFSGRVELSPSGSGHSADERRVMGKRIIIDRDEEGDRNTPNSERRVTGQRIVIGERDEDGGHGEPRPAKRARIRVEGVPQSGSGSAPPHLYIVEEDSDRAAPPAPPAPPRAPAAPRAPRAPRGHGPSPSITHGDPADASYNYAVASFSIPPEDGEQPAAKPRIAGRNKTSAVTGSTTDEKTSQNVTIIEDDDAVTVRMENGKIASVERNGKKVPTNRLRQEDGKLKITDENGKVVYEMELNAVPPPPAPSAPSPVRERAPLRMAKPSAPPPPPAPPHAAQGQLRIRDRKVENVPGGAPEIVVADMPKVIVGIQMADPDRSLIGHFGLKPGEVTMISGIYEDLPASKAGLDLYDIIVAVDGKSPAGQEDVRKSLRNKDDGDIATFTIIHKGQRKDVELKLIPYDPEKMESAKLNAITMEGEFLPGMGGSGQFLVTPNGEQWQAITGKPGSDEYRAKIQEYIDRAQEMSKDAESRTGEANKRRLEYLREFRPDANAGGQPLPPRGEPGSGGPRLQNLEDRLDRLEKMLERLLERRGNDNSPPPPGGRGGPRMSGSES